MFVFWSTYIVATNLTPKILIKFVPVKGHNFVMNLFFLSFESVLKNIQINIGSSQVIRQIASTSFKLC